MVSSHGSPDALRHDVSVELESQFSREVVVNHAHNMILQVEASKHRASTVHTMAAIHWQVTVESAGIFTVL
jgi:hypothetical protein